MAENTAIDVDEPQGLRSNLGGTLWHYRHNTDLIQEFYEYLRNRGLKPSNLLSPEDLKAPEQMVRILIEPEQLDNLPG